MDEKNAAGAETRAFAGPGREYSEALARGLAVLCCFDDPSAALSLSEIARRLAVPRATARRSLLTLVHLGYLVQDGRAFRVLPRVLTLASAFLGADVVTSVLQPRCEALAAEHDATFSIAALDGGEGVMIAYAMPRQVYAHGAGIGLRIPAYCSAIGRVLLGGLDAAARATALSAIDPVPVTSQTTVDRAAIDRAIDRAQAQGFALVSNEVQHGYQSLAVPVCGRGGTVRFALNVGIAIATEAAAIEERFLDLLKRNAAELRPLLT